MPSVALAACSRFPQLDDDDRLLVPALEALEVEACPAVWTDASVDWAAFDAVVIRETWDYADDREAFLAWADRVSGVSLLLNPAPVIRWNTDKHYLRDLALAGIPVVPTRFLEPGDDPENWLPNGFYWHAVIKPGVSCGSRDTMRYDMGGDLDQVVEHVRRLLDAGRSVMSQPYLDGVDESGETALVFLGGQYSHAIRKGPLLEPGVEGDRVGGLFVREQIDPREPTPDERALAEEVVRLIPGGADAVAYARVDLVPGLDDGPLLLELELTEPSLFLSRHEAAAGRLATAIAARL